MNLLRLVDLDADLAAEEALNAPDPEPAGMDTEAVARRVRLLRFLRAERDSIADLFEIEQARIDTARARAVGQLERRIADLEALLAGWAAHVQATQRGDGVPERRVTKSWVLPDGDIRCRRSQRVEVFAGPEYFPESVLRHKTEIDKAALRKLPTNDEGELVDPETGEVFPARVVESVSWTITTGGIEDE